MTGNDEMVAFDQVTVKYRAQEALRDVNILLIDQGRILAEGNVHQIRDLIDGHPHTVHITC